MNSKKKLKRLISYPWRKLWSTVLNRIFFPFFRFIGMVKIFSKDPQVTNIIHSFRKDRPVAGKRKSRRLCVFASYSPTDSVPDFVHYYLQQLKKAGFDIIFVSTSSAMSIHSKETLKETCYKIILRKNIGYDFGSWKAGLFYSGTDLRNYDLLLLANDSCYAPLSSLTPFLKNLDCDICSMTDSFEGKYHLMSYFMLYSPRVFLSDSFNKLWRDVRMLPSSFKELIVQLYEIGMSTAYMQHGFRIKAFFPVQTVLNQQKKRKKITKINPTHLFWKELIRDHKCPIFKVDLFKREILKDNTWLDIIDKTRYPIRLIIQHQNQTLASVCQSLTQARRDKSMES